MSQFKIYIAALLLLIGTISLLQFTLIKYGYAPYGIRNSLFGYENIIAYKTDGRFVKTAKISEEERTYDVYMIGSSRLRDGLDPETITKINGQTAFNYGLSGLLAREMEKIVNHLIQYKKPKTIIIGLDFFAFNDTTKPSDSMVLSSSIPAEATLKLYLSKFSIDIVSKTYQHKQQQIKVFCHKNGFCEDKRFTPEEVGYYIRQGLNDMGKKDHVLANFESYDLSMKAFKRMLQTLSKNDVQVVFYYSPAYSRYHEKLDEISLSKKYDRWQKEINAALLKKGYKIWDFNIASPATTLAFNKSELYFNDNLHFTKYFGDIILETVLETNGSGKYKKYSINLSDE